MSEPSPSISPPTPSETGNDPSNNLSQPGFGWTSYAEIINGRFAMIGFVALLILEIFTQEDFFTWLGLR